MKSDKQDFFWLSFSDLMTSLFFIMLVLYVLTFVKLTNQKNASEQQLKKIQEIQTAVKSLPAQYFVYDEKYGRYSLVRNINFKTMEDVINDSDKVYLKGVGQSISNLIEELKVKYKGQDIRYVVLIEGMASKDYYIDNYQLSYRRALAVKKLWESEGIILDTSVCDVQVAGSGIEGIGRYPREEEHKNQRILIQIIPKIGKI
ncbi:hypothetical protein AFK20_11880 [Enhydrobacter aerosaccus]|jgi:outer membrane protein OmpA-like peptidoglycan-associated protein|uniref:OmpA family protein n=1 Tax=Enhydrobacter aerosaccus TaxID=225324 RepID=A0ABR5IJA9_9HYPH|nr:OmpA family protein [Enhydrobacter aerosaccus]KND18079.1 hypothetical protein AFK20_11880 [Enhydrobacter aerosaccus]